MKPESENPREPQRFVFSSFAAAVILLGLAVCSKPLPEQGTQAALLYASRCGQCHRAYSPRSLTAAMWQIQMQVMETKMQEQGVPPLTGWERDTILNYLARNAAQE